MHSSQQSLKDSRFGIGAPVVAATRFVLAACALLIILVDPTEPDRLVSVTYGVLILYSLYSLYVLISVEFALALPPLVRNHPWWIDVVSYLLLISLSSGTNSIFFFFFFFAVLTAALARGFNTAILVVLASAGGFWIVAYLTTPSGSVIDLGRFVLRPLSLLVIGYLMSIWGDYEIRSLRRLELLREIGAVSNPRFGADRTIEVNLRLIRSFFDAAGCLLVSYRDGESTLEIRHETEDGCKGPISISVASNLGKIVCSLESDTAIVMSSKGRSLSVRSFSAFDCSQRKFVDKGPALFESVAELLEARSLLTAPIYYRSQNIGRIFLHSPRQNRFDKSDITFLSLAMDHLFSIVENIRLVDHMASDAAEQERKRIARDIHDSIIQPYIGIQMGIETLFTLVDNGSGPPSSAEVARHVSKLKAMAEQGTEELRTYVHGLSQKPGRSSALYESLTRFAEKFSSGTGLKVEIDFPPEFSVGDRLAAEVFQIIAESVANVRRHTLAETAHVSLKGSAEQVQVEVSNPLDGDAANDFEPRSILQRAESLGGTALVLEHDGRTVVRVTIPL